MKIKAAILCAALLCLGNSAALPDVAQTENDRIAALLQDDVTSLRAMTGDDFVHVDSNGRVRDKAAFISGRENGGRPFSLFVNDEIDIRYYGETAVVVGTYRNAHAGTPPEDAKRARFMRVYVLRDGRWQNVAHQATEIAALS